MTVIFLLIGCSIVLAGCFLYAFFWSVKTGQNEDLYTPSVRILFDDKPIDKTENKETKTQNNANRTV